MHEPADIELLRQYAGQDSEEAFAALVSRHVNMVYSAALRKTGNTHAAEEITQAVFIILAKKAASLSRHTILTGWLYQTARLTASNFLRGEIRRAHREQEAYMQSFQEQSPEVLWPQIAPLLEDAMGKLGQKERDAVALRFFEGKSFSEIAVAAGATENAAKKRVAHALEKLQKIFLKRGVKSTAESLSRTISNFSIQPAPALLAKTVTAAALTKGATASISTATLIKGALKIMAWTNAKTAIVITAAVVLTATPATIIAVKVAHRPPVHLDTSALTPVELIGTVDIQSDDTVFLQFTATETNNTSRIATADSINDAQSISRVVDISGRPMKFTRRPGGGFYIMLNNPVPPGGTTSYSIEGKLVTGTIQANSGSEREVSFTANAGNLVDAHIVQIWRLPAGAALLGKGREMNATTNGNRIELRLDKIMPPNGNFPVNFRYQLAANAN